MSNNCVVHNTDYINFMDTGILPIKGGQMKRLFLMGITALCLALCMPGFAQANEIEETVAAAQFKENSQYVTDTFTKYANSANVNIRKEPNTNSEILGQTLLNTSFEAVLDIGGWTMITTEDGFAYIKSEYLSDTETPQYKYLGRFKISHYCCEQYRHICGTGTGKTATGLDVQPGMISVDPRVIPLGSVVMFNGQEYTAVDTGGMIKGNKIDLAVATHEEALQLGVYHMDIYIKLNN